MAEGQDLNSPVRGGHFLETIFSHVKNEILNIILMIIKYYQPMMTKQR